MPDISIIVPVFNEAENVLPLYREVHAALEKEQRSWELVFVDDCSTDRTWQRVAEASALDKRVRGIRHLRNAGQSAAVWTGVRGSESPVIVTLDGDLQNDPADIPAMLAHLQNSDFVCGKRVNRRDTFVRRVSSRVARSARKRVLKADFADTGCAMRVFKRSALEGILPFNGWHRFLPVLVHNNGGKTLEVPVNHRARVAGVSKYGLGNRLWRGIYDLIGVSWYQKRKLTTVPTETLKDRK
jgi:dolichol-phosphate mannosyltransferase